MNLSYIFVSALLLLGTIPSEAQTLQWVKTIASPGLNGDQMNHIKVDATGNVYTAGLYYGPADMDPGPGTVTFPDDGIFLSKFDDSGNLLWAKSIPRPWAYFNVYGMDLDHAGNMFITGHIQGSTDFDPGPGTATLTSSVGTDVYVAKYDNNGNHLWSKIINNTGNAAALDLDARNNHVYIAGQYAGSLDFGTGMLTSESTSFDMFFAKMDTDGNFIWAKSLGSANWDVLYTLTTNTNEDVILTGCVRNTFDADPGPGTEIFTLTPEVNENFLACYDSTGQYKWALLMGETTQCFDAVTDLANNIFICGGYSGNVDFDFKAGTYFMDSDTNTKGFLSKYDENGNFYWANRFGLGQTECIVSSVVVDNSKDCYVSGHSLYGSIDFDPGAGVHQRDSIGGSDIFFGKYTSGGVMVWGENMGGRLFDSPDAMEVHEDVLYLGGIFANACDFDPGVLTTMMYTDTSTTPVVNDLFLAKYHTAVGTSIEEHHNNLGVTLYPNPANGNFFIELENGDAATITVINSTGSTVFSKSYQTGKIEVNAELPNGFYLVNVATTNGRSTKKLVVYK